MAAPRVTLLFVIASVVCCWIESGSAQEQDEDSAKIKKLYENYKHQAAAYEIVLTDSNTKLDLRPQPVFNWVNPARVGTPRIQRGALYVWTHDGRPEAIGTIFSTEYQSTPTFSCFHELHSLATEPLKATRDGKTHWNTQQSGIEPKPVPDAAPPAQKPSLRLVQMRDIARRFSGYSINYDDKPWNLSLLPQPLYRYEKGNDTVLDGAIFALLSTAGTDPEVLVVVEARRDGKDFKWNYSVCRFTDLKTWIKLDDKDVVWSFENGTNGPYVDSGVTDRYRFSAEPKFSLPEE